MQERAEERKAKAASKRKRDRSAHVQPATLCQPRSREAALEAQLAHRPCTSLVTDWRWLNRRGNEQAKMAHIVPHEMSRPRNVPAKTANDQTRGQEMSRPKNEQAEMATIRHGAKPANIASASATGRGQASV